MRRDLPDARVVYVGREEQVVVLVPGHASDLVRHPLDHKRLCLHLVQVIQPQLLLIPCKQSSAFSSASTE